MDINELLKLNPNSECELKFTFTGDAEIIIEAERSL